MTSFKVLTDNFVIASKGATVTADELVGCDIPALVSGGHLSPSKASRKASGPQTTRSRR